MILASWGFIFWVSDLGPFVEFTASGKFFFFLLGLEVAWAGRGPGEADLNPHKKPVY